MAHCIKTWFIKLFTILSLIAATACMAHKQETVTDADGNVYPTITIGTQVWMAENLKVARYQNGDPIPHITDSTQWCKLTTGAYCNYNNDSSYAPAFGRLYNWHAATDSRNIAPKGWHVPSYEELQTLFTFLGGDGIAGGKMKETGTTHWLVPNAFATNSSGFTALPGGYRFTNTATYYTSGGSFHALGSNGYWWTTSLSYEINAWDKRLNIGFANIDRDFRNKTFGLSIRCIKDKEN